MAETLSVIVATVGRAGVLCDALLSLARQTVAAEIIVIDQNREHLAPVDDVRAKLGGRCVWVRSDSTCLPAARNLGARRARGSILVFCDDDIEAPPTYLESLLARYAAGPWGAVCGPCLGSDASWNSRPPVRDRNSDEAFWRGNFQSAMSMEVVSGMGCNHSMRRSWWQRVGGYDEAFAGSALREESEMFVRLVRAGCRVYYDAACWVYHPRGDRSGGCAGPLAEARVRERFRQKTEAHAYFLYKSFPERARRHMLRGLRDLLLTRQGLGDLVQDPRILLDWWRINRGAARRLRQPPASRPAVAA
jgi:GT2 family glycosyltransferase